MRKSIMIISILCITNILFAHRQHVHQYLTIEAYNLLRTQLSKDIDGLKDHIGGMQGSGVDYVGSKPWHLGYLTTGVWQEDGEDVVFRKALPDRFFFLVR